MQVSNGNDPECFFKGNSESEVPIMSHRIKALSVLSNQPSISRPKTIGRNPFNYSYKVIYESEAKNQSNQKILTQNNHNEIKILQQPLSSGPKSVKTNHPNHKNVFRNTRVNYS